MEQVAVKTKGNLSTLIAAVLIIAATTFVVGAQAGENSQFKQDLKATIEAGDYEAYQEVVASNPNLPEDFEIIDEETFNKLVEAYQLMQEGDKEGAKAILEDVDIPHPFIKFKCHKEKRELTEEEQAKLQEAHELMKEGDKEGALAILEELGIEWKHFKDPKYGLYKGYSEETRDAIKAALEAGDYEAWVATISAEDPDAKILEVVDEEKFENMVERYDDRKFHPLRPFSGKGEKQGIKKNGGRYFNGHRR